MSVKFKVIEKGMPGVVGGGSKKYYALPVLDGEMTLPGLIKAIEKICTVSGADIHAVLYALVDVAVETLADGTIVRMGDLGSMRMSLSSAGLDRSEDVTPAAIRNCSVIFTPGSRIKEMLTTLKFQKV